MLTSVHSKEFYMLISCFITKCISLIGIYSSASRCHARTRGNNRASCTWIWWETCWWKISTQHLDIYSSNDLSNDLCTLWFSGADPNIRDHSGKKAKQYLPTYASTRAHRKRMTSYSDFELSRHCRPTAQTHRGSLIITHLSLDNSDFMSSEAWIVNLIISFCIVLYSSN